MKGNNSIDGKKLAWVLWTILFMVAIYFLLPYILQILNINASIVISGSMTHEKGNQAFFETYWKERGINPEKLPFRHGINAGDLVIFFPQESYKIGDVAVFTTISGPATTTHRIYQLNATHFRDVWDWCITENNSRQVSLVPSGFRIAEVADQQPAADPSMIYQAPLFDKCSYNWLPVSNIKGKVLVVLPGAGLLYRKLQPPIVSQE